MHSSIRAANRYLRPGTSLGQGQIQVHSPHVLLRALPDNTHLVFSYGSADWRSVLQPVVERYRDQGLILYFRGDAAFADPGVYCFLEAEDYLYAIRLKGNAVLYAKIEHLLTRPVVRPPKKPIVLYHIF